MPQTLFAPSDVPVSRQPVRRWYSPAARSLCASLETDDPVLAIRQLARELVELSELDRPSSNLRLLASFQNIREIQECMMSDAGRLIPTGKGLIIQVNGAHSAGRKNLSICHEITHTLIPSYQAQSGHRIDAATGFYEIDQEEEYLCDIGAAELLLPTEAFLSAVGQAGFSLASLPALAADFGASLEATALKAIQAGIGNIAVIVWELGWRRFQRESMASLSLFDASEIPPPSPRLRIRYACSSGSMRSYYFPKNKSVDEHSLIYQAATSDEPVCGQQELCTGKGARPFYTESQAFRYRKDGQLETRVITLAWP